MQSTQTAITESNSGILNETFTIVIPAYNEEKVIGETLREICEFISTNNLNWNVLVSIDGNDCTEEIVSSYSERYHLVSGIISGSRGGKGAAIKRVLSNIDSKYTIMMDADDSLSVRTISSSLNLLETSDVLIFSRYFNNNEIPFLRRFLSKGFNVLVRALLGLNIRDTQSGYKVFKTDKFVSSMKKVGVTNAFFDVALLYYLKRDHLRIREVKGSYSHRRESKFHPVGLVIGQGVSLLAFRIRHSRFYKYVPEAFVSLYYRKFRWI